jgi:formylglycine-generating enzyme required for sulfatase activity
LTARSRAEYSAREPHAEAHVRDSVYIRAHLAVSCTALALALLAGCESVDVPEPEQFLTEKDWRNDLCVFESAACESLGRIGDGTCDIGCYCEAYSFDGGDCDNAPPPACTTDADCAGETADPVCSPVACESGLCIAAKAANNVACDDGDACTTPDVCSNGSCTSTGAKACDDGNPCTDDSCDTSTGCVNSNNTAPCDDDNACTSGDACADGGCAPGAALACDDDVDCTTDGCDMATGCTHTTVDAACDDGVDCTIDGCDATAGCSHIPYHAGCDDSVDCTEDACDVSTGCTQVADHSACDDGEPCTADSCDPATGCVQDGAPLEGTPCDDGQLCTSGDACTAGACVGPDNGCDDGVACTADSCVSGKDDCKNTPSDIACDDGNVCTEDVCDPVADCVNKPLVGACDDGNACTVGETCFEGLCDPSGAPAPDCDDGNSCTADSCDKAAGCVNKGAPLDGDGCDDGDACTGSDVCSGGSCVAGGAIDCDDGVACTVDTCDKASGCVLTPDNTACPAAGACADSVCTVGTGCVWTPKDDATACGQTGACIKGACHQGGMVLVPPGDFWMGCNAVLDKGCLANEKPQHKVTLSAYWIDRDEITQGDFAACVAAGKCSTAYVSQVEATDPRCNGYAPGSTPNVPLTCARASDLEAYCAWKGKRLPTEAEWEKAARGGCEMLTGDCASQMRTYPWGNAAPTCSLVSGVWTGNSCPQSFGVWEPVGSFSPAGDSPYGLRDMAGGAAELVADWFSGYSSSAKTDPKGPANGSKRVSRGYKSWVFAPPYPVRASQRFELEASGYEPTGVGPGNTWWGNGGRCAKDL